MEQQLSSLNTAEPIDFDNLNIVTHPRPPRRRQSGISLVPFRPYVKCLTSTREPFSFANGEDPWSTSGEKETFFKQANARCIGSLLDDCDVSDVIRWDIQADSTRLPMMCKLWMIVDGAVVERGKPHLVQDAAVQVFTAGRNRRMILAAEQRLNTSLVTTFDRRRRQSWHDVNEYHSVPYYQYTRAVRSGHEEKVQCNMDEDYQISIQNNLSCLDESAEEHLSPMVEPHVAKESIHTHSVLQNPVQISIMTQTEYRSSDCSTAVDSDFVQMFNLNLETNENLLSPIVNPYARQSPAQSTSWEITSWFRRGVEYVNRSMSTGDDYPPWWLQLSTNVLLSDHLTTQGESKEKKEKLVVQPSPSSSISPRERHEQSVQTDAEKVVTPPSSRVVRNSSSSMTVSNQYQFIDEIDDGNNDQRQLPFTEHRQRNDSHADLESRSSDYQIDLSSNHDHNRIRRATNTSSKQSDTDYNTFSLAVDHRAFSTPDHHQHVQVTYPQPIQQQETSRVNRTHTSSLGTLLERYERTLRERQRAIAVINDESHDVHELVKHYRTKIEQSPGRTTTTNEVKEERPESSSSSSISRLTKNKYRSMPGETSDEMIVGYVPSREIQLNHSLVNQSPRQRQPRHDYCDLNLSDDSLNSAWIRFNEQRIDELQKRIDLMLQIDDNDEAQFLLSSIHPITNTVTEHIDDLLMNKSKYRHPLNVSSDRILLPRRHQLRLPYRLNQSLPVTPRAVTRSTTPIFKSVRISTQNDFIPHRTRTNDETTTVSRPIVSILRRHSAPRPRRLVEKSHVWKNDVDGKVYILEQFSIPRYYRLYNDVSFREVYQFSRLLESCLDRHEKSPETYTTLIKNYALDHRMPSVA